MKKLEKEKNKLDEMIEQNCSAEKILKQSQKVDELIVEFYKKQKCKNKK